MISHAVGPVDCTIERTMLLSYLPPEEPSGLLMRTLWVLAKPIAGDPSAYWHLTIGKFGNRGFEATRTIPFPGGFPSNPIRVALEPEIRVLRGDMMALRVTPTSADVVPIVGLCVIPEYALTTARR